MTAERQKLEKEPKEELWWKAFAPPSSYLAGSIHCPVVGNVSIIDENFGDYVFLTSNGTEIGATRVLNWKQSIDEGEYVPKGTYYIDDFHISERLRGNRIGECIYKYLEKNIFPENCKEIALRTPPLSSRKHSLNFWQGMGFEIDTDHEGDERTGFRMKKRRIIE
jgi:hypothetical protein